MLSSFQSQLAGIHTRRLLMAGVVQRQLCKLLCEWDSDHLNGNQDEHFMLLGGPWKIPRSNTEEQIDDAARPL